jgi:hypothetical protein
VWYIADISFWNAIIKYIIIRFCGALMSCVVCCVLRVACCVLRVACCVLRVACCVLRVGCCVCVCVACCVLYVVCVTYIFFALSVGLRGVLRAVF